MQWEGILFIQIESPADTYAIELLSRVKCTFKKTTTTRDSFVCTLVRNRILSLHYWSFPGGSESKESDCNAGDTRDPGSVPGSGVNGNGNPTPVFLPEKSRGQRSLVGYSPWNHKESDTTEQITLSLFFHVYRAYSLNNRVYFMHLYFLVLLASKARVGYWLLDWSTFIFSPPKNRELFCKLCVCLRGEHSGRNIWKRECWFWFQVIQNENMPPISATEYSYSWERMSGEAEDFEI